MTTGLLGERLRLRTAFAGIAGVCGVGLLALRANAQLDWVGVVAAVGGAAVMASGVLSKRWAPTSAAPVLATTGWQLTAGGLLLLPLALLVEGVATTLGWLLLGEALTPVQAVGGLVVVAAVVAAQTRVRAPKPAAVEPATEEAVPTTCSQFMRKYRKTSHKGVSIVRIAVLGSTGRVGSRIVTEALDRGHEVTAAVRDSSRVAALPQAPSPSPSMRTIRTRSLSSVRARRSSLPRLGRFPGRNPNSLP